MRTADGRSRHGPAPLDLAAVARCLDPATTGSMLPAAAYQDPQVLAWERVAVFGAGWVCVGRSADVSAPGARRALAVADDAVLLVRGTDGVLRGFFNTCRHRAHELLPCGESAAGRFVSCPYHNWVYDLEGRLHGVPPGQRADLDRSRLGLTPVTVAEWQGFVLVNLSGDAPVPERYLAGLDAHLAPYECDRLVLGGRHEYELAANWKLAVENYHECYHCAAIHPELCKVSSPKSGYNLHSDGLWCGGTMELEPHAATMSLDGHSDGIPMRLLDAAQRRQVLYLQVFPSLLLSLHPDYVMTHVLEPISATRTRVECQWLFPPEAADHGGFDPAYAVDFWDLTNRQDWTACESVQRGLSSRGYHPGPLSAWDEDAVRTSIALVGRAYLDGILPESAAVADPRPVPAVESAALAGRDG